MRRLFTSTARFLAVAAFALAPLGLPAATAGWVPGERMTESINTVIASARDVTDLGDYGYDSNICILSCFLTDGKDITFNRPFDKGKDYLILGGGDKNASDIDIDIYDSAGVKVASDNDDDASPTIKYRPKTSGTFKLKVSLHKTKGRGGAFCTVVFLKKGGYEVPLSNLKAAIETVSIGCEEVDKAAKQKVFFQSGDNQWALYGAVLEQGDDMTITKVKFGMGDRMLVAGGDKVAEDVDVMVLNDAGDVLLRDKSKEPFAFLKFVEDEDKYRGIRFKNTRSRKAGPSLVLTALLRFGD